MTTYPVLNDSQLLAVKKPVQPIMRELSTSQRCSVNLVSSISASLDAINNCTWTMSEGSGVPSTDLPSFLKYAKIEAPRWQAGTWTNDIFSNPASRISLSNNLNSYWYVYLNNAPLGPDHPEVLAQKELQAQYDRDLARYNHYLPAQTRLKAKRRLRAIHLEAQRLKNSLESAPASAPDEPYLETENTSSC